ncbi:MAG TPA: class I SAM-dependent methyltransferase [Armatimonadota bacterium]|nr:class I SAM-dependent methyltransferase [Armatimonadota bacterium]
MDSSSNFSESYDIFTSSDDYATRYAGRVGEWMLKVQEQAVLRMLASYPNASILDVGGGHGQLTPALVEDGYQVTVLASSEECKSRLRPWLDQIAFDVGSLMNMPYPARSFDAVISLRLMAHVKRWEEFIGELARVARKAVIVDYPEVRSINIVSTQLFSLKKRLEPNTRRFQCFREGDLLRVFKEVGFQRSDRFPQYFLPMMLHRALKQPKLSAMTESLLRLTGLTSLLGSPVILKVVRPLTMDP